MAQASNEHLRHRTSGDDDDDDDGLYPCGHEESDFIIITAAVTTTVTKEPQANSITLLREQEKCFNRQIVRPQRPPCATPTSTTITITKQSFLKPRPSGQNRSIIRGANSCRNLGIFIAAVGNILIAFLVSRASGGGGGGSSERMVRLCIASVDPIKLSSQCVMCNRREFPLTVIDCTGITKVNDLIANPLSVQEATCLIYNCRRQVPDVKPEVYHGSVSNAVNYRGGPAGAAAVSNYHGLPIAGGQGGSGSSIYETMTPSGMFGGGYAMHSPSLLAHHEQQQQAQIQQQYIPPASPYMTRLGLAGYGVANPAAASVLSPLASLVPRGLIGGPNLMPPNRQQALPYALVPAPSGFPFGSRKYKAALVPLFR